MENNKNTNENGPYKHFERPTTKRANDKKLKTRAEISKDKKGHPQLWAGIIIVAIILIALIPIIESKLNGSSKNLAQKEVLTSQSSTVSHKKSKKKSSHKSKSKFLADKNGYYTLRAGDTLTEIAKANNTTVAEIIRLNGLTGENDVEVGQTIKVKEVNAAVSTSSTVDDTDSSNTGDTSSEEENTSSVEQTNENTSESGSATSAEGSRSDSTTTEQVPQANQ